MSQGKFVQNNIKWTDESAPGRAQKNVCFSNEKEDEPPFLLLSGLFFFKFQRTTGRRSPFAGLLRVSTRAACTEMIQWKSLGNKANQGGDGEALKKPVGGFFHSANGALLSSLAHACSSEDTGGLLLPFDSYMCCLFD